MTGPNAIEELMEEYRAAVYAKDVDAFLALYDEHARIFDMWGRWVYDGAHEWRASVTEWFGSLGDERSAVEFDDVHTVAGDEIAAAHAFVTFRGLSADGDELRAMNNRLSWALRKTTQGAWKIVHEHTSSPIDFETAKAMLQK